MKKSLSSKILIFLVFFQSISAIAGGFGLVSDPSGSNLGFKVEMLNGVFPSYLVPGLFLLIVLGIIPLLVSFGLVWKFKCRIFDALRIFKQYHWSWNFSFYLGITLIMWINIQLLIIVESHLLHFVYSSLGVLIVFVASLPSVKEDYKTQKIQ